MSTSLDHDGSKLIVRHVESSSSSADGRSLKQDLLLNDDEVSRGAPDQPPTLTAERSRHDDHAEVAKRLHSGVAAGSQSPPHGQSVSTEPMGQWGGVAGEVEGDPGGAVGSGPWCSWQG